MKKHREELLYAAGSALIATGLIMATESIGIGILAMGVLIVFLSIAIAIDKST